MNNIVKIQLSEKPETRTKVGFLFERANNLSKTSARKIVSRIKKTLTFLRQNFDLN